MNPIILLIPIFLPILGGILLISLPFRRELTQDLFTEAAALLTSAAVWYCLSAVGAGHAEIFRFTSGFSVDLFIDPLSRFFALMLSIMWPLVLIYAFAYMTEKRRRRIFFCFYLMTYGVALGIAFAADMITLYIFYELLTLVTIPLVTHYENSDSMYAGRKYAAYTIGGASLGFFAVIISSMYGDGGNFLFGGCLSAIPNLNIIYFSCLVGFIGFGVKAAVFPFHDWLPTASVAPTPVTALLHAVAVVNSGVFAIVRLTWYVYGPELLRGTMVQTICLILVLFSMVYGAVLALRERHLKRRLAYSTMSNLSYMLFGILLFTPSGLQAGLAHMLFHSVIKMSLFLCAGAFMHQTGREYIYEINGVGRKMPATFILYTLGALSLTGIPLFCGFISKWLLLEAGAFSHTLLGYAGVICLILSAFLCALYSLTVSARAFFPPSDMDRYTDPALPGDSDPKISGNSDPALPENSDPTLSGNTGEGAGEIRECGISMLFPIAFFGVFNVVFGLWPGPVLSFLSKLAGL